MWQFFLVPVLITCISYSLVSSWILLSQVSYYFAVLQLIILWGSLLNNYSEKFWWILMVRACIPVNCRSDNYSLSFLMDFSIFCRNESRKSCNSILLCSGQFTFWDPPPYLFIPWCKNNFAHSQPSVTNPPWHLLRWHLLENKDWEAVAKKVSCNSR